jgi:dihydropteroate synthase
VAHGLRLAGEGADVLDVGGESTRPGAQPVSAELERDRVLPVIAGLTAATDAPVSVDTMKPEVAREALAAGASVWNDVYALRAPGAVETAAELGCTVVLMHMQGEPRTMQADPRYDDVVEEVRSFLAARAEAAVAAGVRPGRIWLDPGIGFGKRPEHNLALIRRLDRLADLGFPVLLGVSRKRFIHAIDPTAERADDRLGGTLAASLHGVLRGAQGLRVHDVREAAQALKVWRALENTE